MDFLHAIILGLIQGLTEFLPVSSSAHLILLPEVMTWPDQGQLADITAHAGSLLAVIYYFRRDLQRITTAWLQSLHGNTSADSKLAWYLLLATIPICLAGVVLALFPVLELRSPLVIAGATIVFGLLLWWADVKGTRSRALETITLRDALIIGVLQILAVIPGTSRSGITITAGLLLGLDRQAASRFAFLLAIPTILAASGYGLLQILSDTVSFEWSLLATVFIVSFLSALCAIHYFLKLLDRIAMLPYVVYRIVLGVVLLVVFI